ncbi:MAG: hypothetical protein P8Z34_11375 [Anaerolineales bacterium]|jgi:hypothetical protein
MRNIVSRLLGVGVVIGIGFLINMLRDTTSCSGPKAVTWDDATGARIEESIQDYNSFNDYAEISGNTDYVMRAEQRYQGQSGQATITCLEDINELIEEFFRLEWKMYEAASNGNYDLAYQYDKESAELSDDIQLEFDRLAEKYEDWQTD